MSVEFDEEKKFNNTYRESVSGLGSSSSSPLTNWLVGKNIVRDEKGAKSLMLIIIVGCFGLAIFLLVK